MFEINRKEWNVLINSPYYQFVFIHSPLCGTCKVAKKMLEMIENMQSLETFHSINALVFPDLLQYYEVQSIPCLVIVKNGEIINKIYAFHSVPYMYEQINAYFTKEQE